MEKLLQPWPWYIVGPLIGLFVPLLLWLGNQSFGISSSLRHLCASCLPNRAAYLKYNWKASAWNLFFVAGIALGGFLAHFAFSSGEAIALSAATQSGLAAWGITEFSGLLPDQLFGDAVMLNPLNLAVIVLGGFLIGFGTRYAGGCTSGHAITGLSALQPASVVAVLGFFAGGLAMTHLVLPVLIPLF